MKKTFLFSLIVIGILLITCSKHDDPIQPTDIPTEKMSCHWVYASFDSYKKGWFESPKVYILNSEADIMPHLSCGRNNTFPSVDFEKYSLIVVCATASRANVSHYKTSHFSKMSSKQYKWGIDVTLEALHIGSENWVMCAEVPKLAQNTEIKLDINYIR